MDFEELMPLGNGRPSPVGNTFENRTRKFAGTIYL